MSADRDVPAILLTRTQAAQSLGMSLSSFQRYVESDLPRVYVGRGDSRSRIVLYRPEDITQWAATRAVSLP
jgi:hypothetical protein